MCRQLVAQQVSCVNGSSNILGHKLSNLLLVWTVPLKYMANTTSATSWATCVATCVATCGQCESTITRANRRYVKVYPCTASNLSKLRACMYSNARRIQECPLAGWNLVPTNTLLPPPKKEVMFSVRSVCLSVCLSVCPSDYSQTCERILTKIFGGVEHGSRTKWYNFGGDPDHASDAGVQSPKSGSSGSAEVCAV